MAEIQLGLIEARFADLIWAQEPVTTSELVKLAQQAFQSNIYLVSCTLI